MILDHIGLAVQSIDEAAEHWRMVFGYARSTEVVTNTLQRVRVLFLSKPGSLDIKLIEAVNDASPVYQLARRGGGVHHLCLRCENVERELGRLEALGLRVLSRAQPGEAFENESIAFVYANHGLNVELIDTTKRARRLAKAGEEDPAHE